MKKFAPVVLLLLIAMLIWSAYISPGDMHVQWDGQDLDGPFGTMVGILAGGFGLLVAGVVIVFVVLILSVVFAGVGILAIGALALAAVVLAAMLSPLMLPLLIPAGIVWFCVSRSRSRRTAAPAGGQQDRQPEPPALSPSA
jgi:hypothetical protein